MTYAYTDSGITITYNDIDNEHVRCARSSGKGTIHHSRNPVAVDDWCNAMAHMHDMTPSHPTTPAIRHPRSTKTQKSKPRSWPAAPSSFISSCLLSKDLSSSWEGAPCPSPPPLPRYGATRIYSRNPCFHPSFSFSFQTIVLHAQVCALGELATPPPLPPPPSLAFPNNNLAKSSPQEIDLLFAFF